jgi:cytochrome c peroxidase
MESSRSRRTVVFFLFMFSFILLAGSALATRIVPPPNSARTPKQELGDLLFADTNLSNPPGLACESCHSPGLFWTDPNKQFPTSKGVLGEFGGRNAPQMGYLAFAPYFHFDSFAGGYVGGFFWDGRAPNQKQQAKGPFLNPIEMNATVGYVVNQVRNASYADLFKKVFGPTSLDLSKPDEEIFDLIAEAIAEYQQQPEFYPFSSKFDWYLKGEVRLTEHELNGLALFKGKAHCAACHPVDPPVPGGPILFTDFTYHNIGIPKNPFLARFPQDLGLGAIVNDPAQNGKFKVPTLRNSALTAPCGHNGFFGTLREIVSFYNTRDVPGAWPPPEVPENINRSELGNLGLTAAEIEDIVAFLNALTDGFAKPDIAKPPQAAN